MPVLPWASAQARPTLTPIYTTQHKQVFALIPQKAEYQKLELKETIPCLMLPILCYRTPFYSQQMNLRPKTFGRAQTAYLTTAEAANNAGTPSRPTGQSSSHRQAQARLSPTSWASRPRGLGPSQSLRPQLFPVSSNLKIIQMNISKKRLYELASTPATSFHTAKQKFHKGGFLKRCSSA